MTYPDTTPCPDCGKEMELSQDVVGYNYSCHSMDCSMSVYDAAELFPPSALPLPPAPPLADDVAAFLLGERPLGGVWFSDDHPTEKGKFWWRKHLRAAHDKWRARAEKAEAEVARLREVLGVAVIRCDEHEKYGHAMQFDWVSDARAALTPKGADHE